MELAAGQPHRFGGLGLMVQMPQVRIHVGAKLASPHRHAAGEEIDTRVASALQFALAALQCPLPAPWSAAAVEHPRLHSGLGLGTQLAAGVAAAVAAAVHTADAESPCAAQPADAACAGQAFAPLLERIAAAEGNPLQPLAEQNAPADPRHASGGSSSAVARQAELVRTLARLCGRGKRSAVGLHGFLFGGLVQDFGQEPVQEHEQSRSFGTRSCAFPSDWPIVLIMNTDGPYASGSEVCGAAEETLISRAGATPNRERARMLELSDTCMSSAAAGDYARFTHALDSYMDIAGTLFEPVQAGRYRDRTTAQRVELARVAGLRGVGQSSWGPTVFGLADSEVLAQLAVRELREALRGESVEVIITRAANQGASWRPLATGVQHAS
jgi:predicted sugar kinase